MNPADAFKDSIIDTIFGRFSARCKERLDLTYDYELSTINTFYEISKFIQAKVLIDIGANIGVYSVFLSSMKHIEEVHAFEPAPASFSLLQENLSMQEVSPRLTAYNAAASSFGGTLKFQIVSPLSGANAIVEEEHTNGDLIEVASVLVDDIIQIRDSRICVKVDVEGHELSVLHGMQRVLSQNECFIQIECLNDHASEAAQKFLNGLGYEKIFSFRNDQLFLCNSMLRHRSRVIEIICKHLSKDLAELLQLRRDKRINAREARRLWKRLGYSRDPVQK